MPDFQRLTNRFDCSGLSLNSPDDFTPPKKFQYLQNMRTVEEGTIEVRSGTNKLFTLPGPVHSIFRLNDPTPFNGGIAAVRVCGALNGLYVGNVNGVPALVDAGYSGDPLVAVAAQPIGTVQPYLYVADALRMKKVNVFGTVYDIGIAPPVLPPTYVVQAPVLKLLENFDTAFPLTFTPWRSVGLRASVLTSGQRVNTTIQLIRYDDGTTGNALVTLSDYTNVNVGMVLLMGTEDVLVQDLKLAIEPTTIAAIIYDAGTTGLCTIQPSGGLGTGNVTQLTSYLLSPGVRRSGRGGSSQGAIPIDDIEALTFTGEAPALGPGKATLNTNEQLKTLRTSFSDLDFPAGCLIQLAGVISPGNFGATGELVRILSVQTAQNGVQSFRCVTTATHVAGELVVGQTALRVSTVNTHVAAETVVNNVIGNAITPTDPSAMPPVPAVGGVASGQPFGNTSGGPGGSPPTPAALQIPDHTAAVATAKAQAIAAGYNLTTPCGIAQVAIAVARQFSTEGCGLFRHSSGPMFCSNTDFGSIEADAVMYVSGQIVYILADPTGANTPEFSVQDPDGDAALRFISLGPITSPLPPVAGPPIPPAPPGPTPPPTPSQSFNLGTINGRQVQPDDRFHVSLSFDQAIFSVTKVQILLNVDRNYTDYSRNYYVYEADQNVLQAAFQTTNTQLTTPLDVVSAQSPTRAVPRGSLPGSGIALGSDQWTELAWRVGDMTKIGADTTRNLSDVSGIEILVTVNGTSVVNVQYGSIYLMGGQNPDVGESVDTYTYAYRFRSTITGARSNPSPEILPSAITPRRQDVVLTAPSLSPDPQADQIDWFRRGGANPKFLYMGSSSTVTFTDDYTDSQIAGAEVLEFNQQYQPFPTADLPRVGTCNTAGSAVQWVSGDQFNPRWAPGSQIIVNGLVCTVYQQPTATLLYVAESIGALSGVSFELPSPTLLAGTVPVLFGPYQGYNFGVGDTTSPGQLKWTKVNDPDATSDVNTLDIESASTPLQAGFIWDGQPFVFSTEDLYRIVPTGNPIAPFYAQKTPCGRGLWNRWAFCLTPHGILFLAKDGLFLTEGGSRAVSVSTPDLSPLFPHDGGPGRSVNNVLPPDLSVLHGLRLAYVDGFAYFDYAVGP